MSKIHDLKIININEVALLNNNYQDGLAFRLIDFKNKFLYWTKIYKRNSFIASRFKYSNVNPSIFYTLLTESYVQTSDYNFIYFPAGKSLIFSNHPGFKTGVNVSFSSDGSSF